MNRLFFADLSHRLLLGSLLLAAVSPSVSLAQVETANLPAAGNRVTEDGVSETQLAQWVADLGDDQFHRRKAATRKLIDVGSAAVPALVNVMERGDLETIDRAMHCLTEIALAGPPEKEDGAWGELKRMSEANTASRAALAKASVEEVRTVRESQAGEALTRAGVRIGIDDFMVRAVSTPAVIVQIDENWSGEIDSLGWLRWVKNIEFARVKGPAIRPDVIARLVEMPDLKTVAIVDGDVTVATLRPLQAMTRVDALEFRYVHLDNELADEIAKIPVRISLSLMGTGIPAEKVDEMRINLPGLHIDLRQGGFLGVSCLTGMNTCRVNEVTIGKPAQLAGIESGDEIVGIDDVKIDSFEDLQAAINQKVPGDQVEVQYLRNGKRKSVKLSLGKYDIE
ncbi:putative zinc metalloprotease [Novipirellula aureliae]|uniref:Putative zinc metalloprotease n=1 Tax=Novipirellula aureliae TaxID=2527966 RepID=A0A5C6E7E4_9BACT|nr:PDZ domain-containing protein [Novipirellula aureliae]TWU43396.1 putative zinc metalloprotease [Novipirellula aureliae]